MKLKKFFFTALILTSTAVYGYKPVTYIFDDGINKKEIQVMQSPQKAVTLSQFMTETLLSLGLENKMIGTALLDDEILPELKVAYNKVPTITINSAHSHAISKEAFIATGVDFVSGWEQSITEESTGSLKELEDRKITPFISKGLAPDATIESVYDDFILLGKIFDVSQKAEEIVANMKKEVEPIAKKTANLKTRPKVLLYDSGDGEAFVGGSGLPSNLVWLAGGENIYKDLGQDYARVSFEDIINKNPEIVVVIDYYAGANTEEKIKFLKTHPGLKNIDAVKNNKIYTIRLIELSPGIRNPEAIKKLHQIIYGNKNAN